MTRVSLPAITTNIHFQAWEVKGHLRRDKQKINETLVSEQLASTIPVTKDKQRFIVGFLILDDMK